MSKFKRMFSFVIALLLSLTAAFSLVGCGGGEKIVTAKNTLNVKIKSAGYGTTYIYKLAEQFEKTFAEEGYKINVLAPDTALSQTKILQNVYMQKEGQAGIDIFVSSIAVEDALEGGDYGQCITDITEEVYNKAPIKFDGTEENTTIKEKLDGLDFIYTTEKDGKFYGVPYALSFGGLAVNNKVLKSMDLELPKTTNELFECAEVIMSEVTSAASVKPFTYSTSGNNYAMSTVNPWLAQYEGLDRFNQYWSFTDENGEDLNGVECAEVFNFEGVEKVVEALFEMYDYNMAARGSNSQKFTQAQGQIMNGKAVFYSVGSWMLNEEAVRYAKKVNDITFINIPVISALGTKLFGEGTNYGMSDADCEKVLRAIIDGADLNKTAATIKEEIDGTFEKNFAVEDVQRVCEARGYVKNSSGGAAYLNYKSTKKDLAYKFLRFISSTEAGNLIAANTNTTSPFSLDCMKDSEIPYLKSVNSITSNIYFKQVNAEASGKRAQIGLNGMFPSYAGEYFANKVLDWRVSIYDDDDFSIKGSVTINNQDTKHSPVIGTVDIGGKYTRIAYTKCAQVFAKEIYEIAKENFSGERPLWK